MVGTATGRGRFCCLPLVVVCHYGMDWLDLDLPPQTAFHMEQQRRELQACNDPDVLRSFALGFLQQTHQMRAP